MRAPIFIIGRQHSGNTMLATMLGRHPGVLSLKNEGAFFERRVHLDSLPLPSRVERVTSIVKQETSGEVQIARKHLEKRIRRRLRSGGKAHSPSSIYKAGMQEVAGYCGASRWVRKATSYVFYIEDILRAFPNARLLFLARNALDIAASLKRRGEWRRVLRMIWGWNQGTGTALQWKKAKPNRVHFVRYEDLVRKPEVTVRQICSFVDLPFDPDLLGVAHVNRSETPYNLESERSGVNASRVHYYANVLSEEEEAVVRTGMDSEILEQCYSDLPPARSCEPQRWALTMIQSLGGSAYTLLSDHGSTLVKRPRHALDRIRRRLG